MAYMFHSVSKGNVFPGFGCEGGDTIRLGLPMIHKDLLDKILQWGYIEMANMLPSNKTDVSTFPASKIPSFSHARSLDPRNVI